jgi:hypothetical protein
MSAAAAAAVATIVQLLVDATTAVGTVLVVLDSTTDVVACSTL